MGYYDVLLINVGFSPGRTTPPLTRSKYSIYTATPDPNIPSLYFYEIFDDKIWISVIATLFLILAFLKFYLIMDHSKRLSYFESFNFLIGASSKRTKQSVKPSFRLCQISFAILQFIIAATFSSFLIAQLSIYTDSLPFKNLNEIFQQNDYSLCVIPYEYAYSRLNQEQKENPILNRFDCLDNFQYPNQTSRQLICEHKKGAYILFPPLYDYGESFM